MTIIKATVQNRRIDVAAPSDIPDGTNIMLTISESGDRETLSTDEIARILTAMQTLEPWEIPETLAADLDDWEKKLNERGIEYHDPSVEGIFP